jgi:hypothetical protein
MQRGFFDINSIRSAQAHCQAQVVLMPQPDRLSAYQSRDPVSGDRLLTLSDGSVLRTEYRGSTEIDEQPYYRSPRSLGLLGEIW